MMTSPLNMEIKPYIGIDKITFGMTPEEIRKIIGGELFTFHKGSSETITDHFREKNILVYYDIANKCEAIEFAAPANPTFQGLQFIEIPFFKAKEEAISLDDKLEIIDTGFISYKYGFGVYVSSLKETLYEPIEGVIIFKKGYYE